MTFSRIYLHNKENKSNPRQFSRRRVDLRDFRFPHRQMAYRWRTDGVQMAYRWRTDGVQMAYRWRTARASYKDVETTSSSTPNGVAKRISSSEA